MQAHEATMHQIDAEFTAGLDPSPIEADLAADGVNHAFTWAWWVPCRASSSRRPKVWWSSSRLISCTPGTSSRVAGVE